MVRFGHVQRFDERSRDYTIADTLLRTGHTGIHDRRWNAHGLRLKQPPMACTGYSRTIDLRADPAPVTRALGAPLDDQFARTLYRVAQRYDARPGENYQGASVLGALKACKALGLIGEYRWAFNIDDALSALTHIGGLVAGTNWYRSMLRPRPSGLLDVDPSSGVFDGHAYYVQGLLVSPGAKWRFLTTRPVPREPLVVVLNSLGAGWGRDGFAAIRVSDFETLLEDRGGLFDQHHRVPRRGGPMTAALTVVLIGALVLIGGLAWLLQSAWPLIAGGLLIALFGAFRVDAVEARNQ